MHNGHQEWFFRLMESETEDVSEEVLILTNDDGVCYAESQKTQVPKTISDCTASAGDTVTIKYGVTNGASDLAWAVIVE